MFWIPAYMGMTGKIDLLDNIKLYSVFYSMISGRKSRRIGLFSSSKRNFHCLFHFLSCFSRVITFSIVSCNSYQTKRVTLQLSMKSCVNCSLC